MKSLVCVFAARSLPSWRSLLPTEGQELNRTVCSEEEMRALNLKEAMILISNLSTADSLIPQQEIITDVTQMRTVANVHESLVNIKKKDFSVDSDKCPFCFCCLISLGVFDCS